jgi:hypothetical protein
MNDEVPILAMQFSHLLRTYCMKLFFLVIKIEAILCVSINKLPEETEIEIATL